MKRMDAYTKFICVIDLSYAYIVFYRYHRAAMKYF